MFHLLQAAEGVENATQAVQEPGVATQMIESVQNGEVSQVLQQIISFGIEAGKSILVAIIIYMVGKFAIRLVNKVLGQMMARRKMDSTIQSFLKSFVNILLTILLIITVVSALGVNTTSFAALLASLGVAIGMAVSGNLQNLAGGIILLIFKPFKVGDFIEAQGVSGTVKEIQIIHTLLLTPDNREIYLPNGALSSSNVTNYSKMDTRRVDFTIGVEYGTDVKKVHDTLQKLIAADSRILQTPEPFIGLAELADSSVNFTLRVWVKGADYWGVYFDMNSNVYETFNREGIGFPFPQVQVHQS